MQLWLDSAQPCLFKVGGCLVASPDNVYRFLKALEEGFVWLSGTEPSIVEVLTGRCAKPDLTPRKKTLLRSGYGHKYLTGLNELYRDQQALLGIQSVQSIRSDPRIGAWEWSLKQNDQKHITAEGGGSQPQLSPAEASPMDPDAMNPEPFWMNMDPPPTQRNLVLEMMQKVLEDIESLKAAQGSLHAKMDRLLRLLDTDTASRSGTEQERASGTPDVSSGGFEYASLSSLRKLSSMSMEDLVQEWTVGCTYRGQKLGPLSHFDQLRIDGLVQYNKSIKSSLLIRRTLFSFFREVFAHVGSREEAIHRIDDVQRSLGKDGEPVSLYGLYKHVRKCRKNRVPSFFEPGRSGEISRTQP